MLLTFDISEVAALISFHVLFKSCIETLYNSSKTSPEVKNIGCILVPVSDIGAPTLSSSHRILVSCTEHLPNGHS